MTEMGGLKAWLITNCADYSTVYLLLLSFVWIAVAGAQGQTLYQYIDKDGTVIITDSPPPGVKSRSGVAAYYAGRAKSSAGKGSQ